MQHLIVGGIAWPAHEVTTSHDRRFVMALAVWKRTLLGAMVALSVAGVSLTGFSAAHAAVGDGGSPCPTYYEMCGMSAR